MKSLGLLLLGLVFYSCNQNVTMDNIEDLKNDLFNGFAKLILKCPCFMLVKAL